MYKIHSFDGLGFEDMPNVTYYTAYKDGYYFAKKDGEEPWEIYDRSDNTMMLTRSLAWRIADHLFPDGDYYWWQLPEWVDKGRALNDDEALIIDCATREIIAKVWR